MLSTPKAKAELFLASSLYDGLEDNNIMQVTTLLLNKEADPNVLIPSQGITPFHLVIGNDSETFAEEVTKLFLRHGGNPNVKSVDGMTPVHVAAAWGRLGVLQLLLSNGGDPLLVDDDGRCPFHYAFDEAHYDAVATLGKYCGESFEEDSDLKYNIALGKILVSNGGIVGEYEVSDETFATTVSDVPTIPMSKVSNNNNNLLENLNKRLGPLVKTEIHVPEWEAKYSGNTDSTMTTTADESSVTLPNFVNTRRHRRCLPQKSRKRVESKLGKKDEFECAQADLQKQNTPALNNDKENLIGIPHLNDPMIEASFLVQPQKIGENMPCISSPKANKKKLVKLERDPGTKFQDVRSTKTTPRDSKMTCEKSKFTHKTPLRCSTKKGLAEIKKAPSSTSAKQTHTFNGRTTPKSGTLSSNGKAIRTPGTYVSKQILYSPDCSIVSKSPNMIIKTPVTLTNNNNYKLREDGKITISRVNGGTPGKDSRRIPTCGSNYKTPTPDKICSNARTGGRNFSRFVKQSDLRHQGTKKTPISSPTKFRDSPTWSKKSPRTPNLTDSTKQKKKLSTGRKKTVFTPSHSAAHSPATPFNKTYSKSKYFDPSGLSPDVENTNRFVNRRAMAKHIAIKLEESMYDEDYDKNIIVSNKEKMAKTPNTVTTVGGIGSSESSVTQETDISNIIDNRRHRIGEKIDFDHVTSKRVQVSGINTIADSTNNSRGKAGGVCSSRFNIGARTSNIIAGYFQPSDMTSSSFRTSNADEILNNAIIRGISGPYSNMPSSNRSTTRNTINRFDNETEISCGSIMLAAGLRLPNSKEIDNSLVSSEPSSSYFQDCHNQEPHCSDTSNLGDTNLLTERNELFKYGSDELSAPRSTGENCLTDMRQTCSVFPNISSSVDNSSYMSFVSVEEEYKYEDAEEGVVLLERRLLVTPVSIPMIKAEHQVPSPSEKGDLHADDESMESRVSSLPHSLLIMDGETLRRELTKLDNRPPGPITATTRHVYLKRLRKLQKHGPAPASMPTAVPPKFSTEIERTLRSESWINDLSPYQTLEQQVFNEFSNPDPTRRWREGTTKSSFNYLLMDPRITDNLPRRADKLSPIEQWQTFLASIFYVGKGRRSRPYAHLYEAYGEWKKGLRETSDKKINSILDIWKSNCGVVCLHLFQNTIPVEAYTREAAMIEALGLDRLKNLKLGEYYGIASTWSHHQKRTLGVYLLYRAMHIFINEGERQLSPDDIGR